MPESTKDKIIQNIVESFTEIFRQFFRFKKTTKEAKNDNA